MIIFYLQVTLHSFMNT